MPNAMPAPTSRIRPAPLLTVTARRPATSPPPAAAPDTADTHRRTEEPPSRNRLYGAGQRIANAKRLEEQPG